MFEFIRRLGLLPLKSLFRRNSLKRRQRRLSFDTEALESRVLLAADLGAEYNDTIPIQYAFYFSLSRGRDELLRNAGYSMNGSRLANSSTLSSNRPVLEFERPERISLSFPQSASAVASEAPPAIVEATDLVLAETVASIESEPVVSESVGLASDEDPAESEAGDVEIQVGETAFVIYNELDGELRVETVDPVGTISIASESEIFTQTENAINLDGDFDIARPDEIFKIDFGGGFGSVSFGNVAETGLTEEFINNDLNITGAPPLGAGGGTLSGKDVVVDLTILDTSGSAIDTINVGENFVLRATVEDTRFGPNEDPDNLTGGVFAAFMDVAFDGALATADSIEYGDTYDTARTGTISSGLIDELGGVAGSINPIGKSARTLYEVQLTATAEGELVFSTNAADQFPNSETLLFGVNDPIDPLRIRFDTASITVNDPNPTENDLVAFAQALADSGTIFYGASWCPHCTEQKELFEDGQDLLPFVEVTNYENEASLNNLNQAGIDNNITSFPTWEFPDGSRLEGLQDLATLSTRSGVAIPQSNVPTIVGLGDVDLFSGSPLQLAINGWDPNGDDLTYEVTSSDPDLVDPTIIDGGRSLLIDVAGPTTYGKLQFQLFEEHAPRASGQIIALAESGFYDGVGFHRVINDFVIQGGDPTGTGSGGSDLGDFDDDFHPDLQHNQTGLLSMAKTIDDTNDSQFFITEGPTRHLDFNHSIFGVLTEGENNRDAISNAFTTSGDRPAVDIIMDTVTVIDDNENAVVQLKAPEGASGTADITITATDPAGHVFSQTFEVTVTPDTQNGQPFLDDIVELDAFLDEPFALPAIDVEGDTIFSQIAPVTSGTFTASTDPTTGEITISSGTVGQTTADVWVSSSAQPTLNTSATNDFQRDVVFNLGPRTPVIDLQAGSDLGASDSDNLTSADSLDFEITNLQVGASVELFSVVDSVETSIGTGTATTDSVVISTSDLTENGEFDIIARQTLNGITSLDSDVLVVEIDRQDLSGFTSTAPSGDIIAEVLLSYDAEHPNEGDSDFVYSLDNAPAGAVIDANTGELTWTPTDAQIGQNTFSIVVTDAAGNTASQEVDVNVTPNTVIRVRLEVTDLSGNPIVAVQQSLDYQIHAFVDDLRLESSGDFGLTQAYFDVDYDGTLTSVNSGINFSADFPDNQTGDIATAGTFDEIGASTTAALGSDEFLLWSITMTADAEGTVNFAANMPEATQFALTDFSEAIGASNVTFVDTSIQIVDEVFAQPDTADAVEDGPEITIPALANDLARLSGGPISIQSVDDPANGTASVSSDNENVLYTPDANFNGPDVFSYTITDGTDTAVGSITVNVSAVNDAPVASDDTITVAEDATDFELDVLANDNDIDEDTLTITDVTSATNGTVTISSDGSMLLYTANANFVGLDNFSYTISDGEFTSTADVNLTIQAVNDPPVAVDDQATGTEDEVVEIDAATLLANDNAGPEEGDQTITVVRVQDATNGTVDLSGTDITFTPDPDFNGQATFTYTIRDDGTTAGETAFEEDTGTVTIDIAAVNDPPVASDDTETVRGDETTDLQVLSNDTSEPDANETLTIDSIDLTNTEGTAEIVGDVIRYTPPEVTSITSDSFTYTISDGTLTDTATVNITIDHAVLDGVQGVVTLGSSTTGISQTEIHFVGTDINGDPVNRVITTGNDGSFSLSTVLPGTYTISAPNLPFMVNTSGGDGSVTVELTADGLGDQTIDLGNNIINPKFAIWESFSSVSNDGIYAAVSTGGGELWFRELEGWADVTVQDIAFTANQEALTISIDNAGVTETATVSVSDASRIRVIGHEGDARLIRIVGPSTNFTFVPPETA